MIFLIEYDRRLGKRIQFKSFRGSERSTAEELRLNLDLELNKKAINHEVVLLEAKSEAALRKTHRRYFESSEEIGNSLKNTISSYQFLT